MKVHSTFDNPKYIGINTKAVQAAGYDPSTRKSVKAFIDKPTLKICVPGHASGSISIMSAAMVHNGFSSKALRIILRLFRSRPPLTL